VKKKKAQVKQKACAPSLLASAAHARAAAPAATTGARRAPPTRALQRAPHAASPAPPAAAHASDMRRGQRVSARGERIIHGADDAVFTPRRGVDASARLTRGQAKIRELEDGGAYLSSVSPLEERVRYAFAADQFGSVGADVAEAAAALGTARVSGGVATAPAAGGGKAAAPKGKAAAAAAAAAAVTAAPPQKRAFSLVALPKPVKHLLAGAFSGGASRGRRTRGTRTRTRLPRRTSESERAGKRNIGLTRTSSRCALRAAPSPRAFAQACPRPPRRRWRLCA
jgi:hypothetical protein